MFFLQWARAKFYCEAALPGFKPGACLKPSSSFDVLTIWMDTVFLTRHVRRWGVSRSPPCWAEHIGMSFKSPQTLSSGPRENRERESKWSRETAEFCGPSSRQVNPGWLVSTFLLTYSQEKWRCRPGSAIREPYVGPAPEGKGLTGVDLTLRFLGLCNLVFVLHPKSWINSGVRLC